MALRRAVPVPTSSGRASRSRHSRDGEHGRTDIAVDRSRLEQLDARAGVDVAVHLAAHDDHGRGDLAGDVGPLLDGHVALDVDVALEPPGDAHVSGTFDLALDRDVGGDQ
jgi:hypothetical protein